MAVNTHIIRRQTLDLRLADGHDAHAVQDMVSRIHSAQVLPWIDEVMSHHAADGEWLRIGRLELDLGSLELDELETQLPDKIRACLDEALEYQSGMAVYGQIADVLHDVAGPDDQPLQLSAGTAALAVLVHYLNSGLTPWWHSGDFDVDHHVRQLLAEDQAGLLACLQSVQPDSAGKRLSRQLANTTLTALLAVLLDEGESSWHDESRDWERLLATVNQGGPLSSGVLNQTLLPAVLSATEGLPLSRDNVRHQLIGRATADLADVPGTSLQEKLPVLRSKARAVLKAESPARVRLERLWETAKAYAQAEITIMPPKPPGADEVTGLALRRLQGQPQPEQGEQASAATAVSVPTSTDGVTRDGQIASAQDREGHPADHWKETQSGSHVHHTRPGSQGQVSPGSDHRIEHPQQQTLLEQVADLAEGYFLANAGLVLLWPFLPGFFQQLGLADKQTFLTVDTHERAVLLSSFLSDGETRCQENRLLLNKLLCGWPLLEPLALELQPSELECTEVEELLGSVIGHWQSLGNTSIEGFRQAFLHRQGRLQHDDMGWLLTVDRAAHDVLLDSLPWSLGLISLPWMAEPIRVEW